MPKYTDRDVAYYQKLHESEPYLKNNWLMDELESVKAFRAKKIAEVGCGNGRFLALISAHADEVFGYDWAMSSNLSRVLQDHANVRFSRQDLRSGIINPADLVVSADVLEHLEPEDLEKVITKLDAAAPMAFHKIACYDDGNCHQSVLTPVQWLDVFQKVNPAYRIERIEKRLGLEDKPIVVITKGRPFRLEPPIRISFGCGDSRRPGFVGVDIRYTALGADLYLPSWEAGPFTAGSVEEIYSRHMLEHLTPPEANRTLENWRFLLKSGGKLNVIVPDLAFHARQLLGTDHAWNTDARQNMEHAMAGFYGWCAPNRGGDVLDAHRWGYTYESLVALLANHGFALITRVRRGEDSERWHLNVTAVKP